MTYEEKRVHKSNLVEEVRASLSDARRAYLKSSIEISDNYKILNSEPVGKFLVELRHNMNVVINLETNGVNLSGYPIGGCYLHALEYMMELTLPGKVKPPMMSTADVFWEVYRWHLNSYVKTPDFPPLVLDVQFWPTMPMKFSFAMMDASAPRFAGVVRFPEDEMLYNLRTAPGSLPRRLRVKFLSFPQD